jgi:hypothetical protein
MVNFLYKSFLWAKQKIKHCDSYPQSVQMAFDGDSEFTTFFGGAVSLLIKTVVILYAILLAVRIIQKSDTDK